MVIAWSPPGGIMFCHTVSMTRDSSDSLVTVVCRPASRGGGRWSLRYRADRSRRWCSSAAATRCQTRERGCPLWHPSLTRRRFGGWGRSPGAVMMLAVIVHLMATGVSILAGMIGPGIWGYLGAVGWLGLVGPLPILLLGSRGAGRIMMVGASTIAVAGMGSEQQWPGWAVAVWLATVPGGYLAARAILSMPARLTHRRAAQLLRNESGTGTDAASWSLGDWERAYTRLGTPIALNEAALCRMLQMRIPQRIQTGETRG